MNWEDIRNGTVKLIPADIILTRGYSPYAYGIRFFTRSRKESKSIVNHACIVEREVKENEYNIIDIGCRVYKRSLYDYDDGKTGVIICRDITLKKKERLEMIMYARRYLGRLYSPLKVIGQLLDGVLGKITGKNHTWITDKLSTDWLIICSYVVAKAYAYKKRFFGLDAGVADPDDMLDFIASHLGKKYNYVFISDNMMVRVNLPGSLSFSDW